MMKTAWISPYPPLRTGLAPYSSGLTDYLNRTSDNTYIRVSPFVSSDCLYIDDALPGDFDRIVYNIGLHPSNSVTYNYALRYPGTIILHDINIHDLVLSMTYRRKKFFKYFNIMLNENEDRSALKDIMLSGVTEDIRKKYTMLSELLCSDNSFIVHSDYGLQKLRELRPGITVSKIKHFSSWHDYCEPDFSKKVTIGVFGFLSDERKIELIIEQFIQFIEKRGVDHRLFIVGNSPDNSMKHLPEHDSIEYVTDADDREYLELMKYVDGAVNIRYPGYGEMSGNLIKLMGMGKPVLVNRNRSFREIDSSAVIFIENSKLEQGIRQFFDYTVDNPDKLKETGLNAYKLIEEKHSIEKIAPVIEQFLIKNNGNSSRCGIRRFAKKEIMNILGKRGIYKLIVRGLR